MTAMQGALLGIGFGAAVFAVAWGIGYIQDWWKNR